MDQSRLTASGLEVIFVKELKALVDVDTDLVVVDLSRPGVIDVLKTIDSPLVGFSSHVDEEIIDKALEAGCDQVFTRSRFFRFFQSLASDSDH
tara:strand:- start:102 stop:380 length:279 start_codon:yes stop_codon:yes gene_type:complete